jgi:hypothetical protein
MKKVIKELEAAGIEIDGFGREQDRELNYHNLFLMVEGEPRVYWLCFLFFLHTPATVRVDDRSPSDIRMDQPVFQTPTV